MRLFAPHVAKMKQPHFACVGEADRPAREVVEQTASRTHGLHLPLEATVVAGDHFTNLPRYMAAYLGRVSPKVK